MGLQRGNRRGKGREFEGEVGALVPSLVSWGGGTWGFTARAVPKIQYTWSFDRVLDSADLKRGMHDYPKIPTHPIAVFIMTRASIDVE